MGKSPLKNIYTLKVFLTMPHLCKYCIKYAPKKPQYLSSLFFPPSNRMTTKQ